MIGEIKMIIAVERKGYKSMNNDLISRQAAIDALKDASTIEMKRRIENIPPEPRWFTKGEIEAINAQSEPRWIPCESEPPNKYGNYLITTEEGEVDIGTYSPDRPGAWSACDAKGFHWVSDVVAWMPLPESYRGE